MTEHINNKSRHLHENMNETNEILKSPKKNGFGYYFGLSVLVLIVLGIATLIILAINSPEIGVMPGKQMNKEYVIFVKEKGLLGDSEVIHFWYSDGFGDFKKGFYFFTNEKVVLYSKNWDEPALLIPYAEILDIEFERNSSRWEDSYITLYLKDESVVFIPVSNTNKGDVKFHDRLVSIWNENY